MLVDNTIDTVTGVSPNLGDDHSQEWFDHEYNRIIQIVYNRYELDNFIREYAKVLSIFFPDIDTVTAESSLMHAFDGQFIRYPIKILDLSLLDDRTEIEVVSLLNRMSSESDYSAIVISNKKFNESGIHIKEVFSFINGSQFFFYLTNVNNLVENSIDSNPVHQSFREVFSDVERALNLPGARFRVVTGSEVINLLDTERDILENLSKEFQFNWGQYPYNEGLISPDAIDDFDPNPSHKIGDYHTMDEGKLVARNLAAAESAGIKTVTKAEYDAKKSQGWVDFWSPERTYRYIAQAALNRNFCLAVIVDSHNQIIAWYICYEVDPNEKIGRAIVKPNSSVIAETALYTDTVGFGSEYRSGEKRKYKQIIEALMREVEAKLSQHYQAAFTRLHINDSKVLFKALEILGYHDLGVSASVDYERLFIGKGLEVLKGEFVQTQSPDIDNLKLREKVTSFVDSNLPLLIERIQVGVGKVEEFLIQTIELYANEHKKLDPNIFELKLSIENGDFRRKLMQNYFSREGIIELILTWPVSLILAVITHGHMLIHHPQFEALLVAFEAIPLAGGVSALYRTLYLELTTGIPQTIENFKNGESNKLEPIFRSLGSFFDGGALIVPLLKEKSSSTIAMIMIWRVLKEVKNTPSIFSEKVRKTFNKYFEV